MKNTILRVSIAATMLVLGIALGGCSTPFTLPSEYNYQSEMIFNQNYDKVWSRLVEICVEINMPIEQMDKYNSIIRSKAVNFSNDYKNCDCGIPGKGFGWYGKIENVTGYLNAVLTKIDEKRTKVKLIFHFAAMYNIYEMDFNTNRYYHSKYQQLQCNSTGRLEKMIFDELVK